MDTKINVFDSIFVPSLFSAYDSLFCSNINILSNISDIKIYFSWVNIIYTVVHGKAISLALFGL